MLVALEFTLETQILIQRGVKWGDSMNSMNSRFDVLCFCVFFSEVSLACAPRFFARTFLLCLIRFLTSQLLLRVSAYISCFKEAAASLVTRLVLEALDWNSINGGWRFADCDMEVIWSAVSFDVVWVVPLWLSWTRCKTCCQSGEACQRTQGERSKVRRIRHGQSNKSIPLDW